MKNNNYLSGEEQFKEILNNEEIDRIKDPELRNIRSKYWGLRHQVFLDEHKISDRMFVIEHDRLTEEEKKEINEYRQRNNKG